jgi:hypothetical protein
MVFARDGLAVSLLSVFLAVPAWAANISVPPNATVSQTGFTLNAGEQLGINAPGGVFENSGGTGEVLPGGEIFIEFDLNNPGQLINDGTVINEGVINNNGGFVNNGFLDLKAGVARNGGFQSIGRVRFIGDSVFARGRMDIQSGGEFAVVPTVTATLGEAASPGGILDINNGGTGTNEGTINVINSFAIEVSSGGTFTNPTGRTIDLNGGGLTIQSSRVANNGAINNTGGSLTVDYPFRDSVDGVGPILNGSGSYVASGVNTATRVFGELRLPTVEINGGTLLGSDGVIEDTNGAVTVGASATIAPGIGPERAGTLNFDGDLDLDGTYGAEILENQFVPGIFSMDLIDVDGTVNLGATSTLDVFLNFNPAFGASYTILTANAIVGTFGTINISVPGAPDEEPPIEEERAFALAAPSLGQGSAEGYEFTLNLVNVAGGVELRATVTRTPDVIPEPVSLALLGGGMLALLRRR